MRKQIIQETMDNGKDWLTVQCINCNAECIIYDDDDDDDDDDYYY